MAAIACLKPSAGTDLRGAALWPAVAAMVADDAARHGRCLRDVVVLVPYAALIDPLRSAFAARPGWQPRVETALTLAQALAPGVELQPGECSGDPALDRLQALRWLAAMPTLDVQEQAHAAALLADAAAALRAAAAERPPWRREAWWAQVRDAIPPAADGPGAAEAALLRAALAWAQAGSVAPTDLLFGLHPAAWYVLRLGGADRLGEALLERDAGALVDLDPAHDEPFAALVSGASPLFLQAEDFEEEAWAAAAQVLQALQQPTGRVALVALDRALVRRMVALLRRAGVELDDETGWKLSTHAAAGRVLARLRAARSAQPGDEALDWLKRWPPASGREPALQALEQLWRLGRNARLDEPARAAAQALWHDALAVLAPWRSARDRSLLGWLQLLKSQLDADGDSPVLAADPAGLRLLQLLQADAAAEPAWQAALQATRVDLAGFAGWFESWCEATPVQQAPQPQSRVVLTPLSRAVGRPFAQVVVAGADRGQMGPGDAPSALIGDALASRIGLPTESERRLRQRLALAQLLRQGGLTLLWRRREGDAALGPADDLLWMLDSARCQGLQWAIQAAPAAGREVAPQPVQPPQPRAAQALPAALSASAVENLRQCPYRFFARSVLRLVDPEEIERDADKRDWGDWLHLTLHRFHAERREGQDDAAALLAAAAAAEAELALDAAAMLPFRATLEPLLRRYLAWLAPREAEGWHWQGGEQDLRAAPPGWAPQQLRGRLDRIDRGPGGRRQLLDYKTTRVDTLRSRVAEPLEDTQLAFYVALLQPGDGEPIDAAYLALDEDEGPVLVPHPEVAHSAATLVQALGAELERLRQGAALPALGEGTLCDGCEARGLCRRDHWAQPTGPVA